MNSSTNNTAFKKRAIRVDVEEKEFFEQEQAEEVSNKVMGRPSKKNMAVAEASGSSTTITNPDSQSTGASSTTVIDLEQTFDGLSRRSRSSNVMAYRMPFEHLKNFCDKNRHRYPVNPLYPYTVGPIESVVAFFKEFVFKRTYMKNVSLVTNVRTQIGLRTEHNSDMAEDAPSKWKGNMKVIEAPVGIDVVKQYKKIMMSLHGYQSSCREVGYTSPKDKKELTELIKKYQHYLIYDEVQTNADRSSHCVIRDSYKSGELIRTLKNLWIANALEDEEEFASRATHGGRNSGAMEAEMLETHYFGKLPVPFARELQKTIFPWIESYFGVNNKKWEAACSKEMNEVDDNKDVEANMLNMVLNNEVGLEEHVEDIEFVEEDDQFKESLTEVFAAAASPSISRLEDYEGLVSNLVDTHKDMSRRVVEANQRIASFQQQYDNRSERFDSSFENHVVHTTNHEFTNTAANGFQQQRIPKHKQST
ncbi:hypothetical protein BD770DRAFT_477950 [Pilaira anomala]|nr:hypothetical protein BD770DRAFT_477950 [Pilaira anomala]